MRAGITVVAWSLSLVACELDDSSVEPLDSNLKLTYVSGVQFAEPGRPADALTIKVRDAESLTPVAGVPITWSVVQGKNTRLEPVQSITSASGEASTTLFVGAAHGTYIVRATTSTGERIDITIRAVFAPQVTEVAPSAARGGETFTIRGRNFSAVRTENIVRVGTVTAVVTSATPEQLRVVVPECVAPGLQPVVVQLGSVTGNTHNLNVQASSFKPALNLAVGQAVNVPVTAGMDCVRVTSGEYLVLVQNTARSTGTKLPFELALSQPPVPSAAVPMPWQITQQRRSVAQSPEARLQAQASLAAWPRVQPIRHSVVMPVLGESRRFNVGWLDDGTEYTSATLRAMSSKALIYVDTAAAEMYSEAQLQELAALFDQVIYPANVENFGEPSDLDGNGRVILLFTPAVNKQTAAGSATTLVGFAAPCDIKSCNATNAGEILYLVVPDGAGKFGKVLKGDSIIRSVPRTIAHELVHVIQFGQRHGLKAPLPEEVWLAEGMAHQGEELIASAFDARGEVAMAESFRDQNYKRAMAFLTNAGGTGLLESTGTGSPTERGAQWLFVNYLSNRFGPAVLRSLTQTGRVGADNVSLATGQSWPALLADWALAVYSKGAGDDSAVRPSGDFSFSIRQSNPPINDHPLQPLSLSAAQPFVAQTLLAGGTQFMLVDARGPSISHLSVTDVSGSAPVTAAQLVIRRLR